MKQKNNLSDVLTKNVLKQELGGLEKRMDKKFVTKDFFENSIDKLLQGIRREFTFTIEGTMVKFEEKLTKHTSLILTTVDPLLKELETRRQDREIASDHSIRVKQRLDNHKKRIAKLEHLQQTA